MVLATPLFRRAAPELRLEKRSIGLRPAQVLVSLHDLECGEALRVDHIDGNIDIEEELDCRWIGRVERYVVEGCVAVEIARCGINVLLRVDQALELLDAVIPRRPHEIGHAGGLYHLLRRRYIIAVIFRLRGGRWGCQQRQGEKEGEGAASSAHASILLEGKVVQPLPFSYSLFEYTDAHRFVAMT